MDFDPTKPVQTRDGRPARILCTDLNHPNFKVAAAYVNRFGVEITASYCATGEGCGTPASDLVNVPEKRTVWVNVYEHDGFASKEDADRLALLERASRIACIPLTFTVGEGL